jgi:two-component system sensor histidine kinase RegB
MTDRQKGAAQVLASQLGLIQGNMQGGWIRLRTLILLRWVAIVGQLTAITIADRYFGIAVPSGLSYLAIGAAIIANLISIFVFPENKRLGEREALAFLLFDLGQLAFLIFLNGGLTNPFALLLLGPVIISASALQLRSTVILGALAIAAILVLLLLHLPLKFDDGTLLRTPVIFEIGFAASIVVAILFLGLYARRVAGEIREMSDALVATQLALAREQKLTDLGGVVAAAAHELGTPLATIKLVSSELLSELADKPELAEDARLIRDQADRCRDILRGMGQAGKDDVALRQVPVGTLLREAAGPHADRGKQVMFLLAPGPGGGERQPVVLRKPEIVHGLRNLIQNAVDYARARVWIEAEWTGRDVTVRIADDGAGFPPQMLGRIGDPFLTTRRGEGALTQRPGYEGMGLGLFIAKTLLERSGASFAIANGSDPFLAPEERPERSGAIVEVTWPNARILAPPDMLSRENRRIEAG